MIVRFVQSNSGSRASRDEELEEDRIHAGTSWIFEGREQEL